MKRADLLRRRKPGLGQTAAGGQYAARRAAGSAGGVCALGTVKKR